MSSPISDRELLAYASGELNGAEAARIEQALQSDPEARATVARYRAARAALRSDRSVPAPPEVVARARAIFGATPGTRPAGSWLARLDAAIARMVFDSRLTPALAGFRGGSEPFQAAWETDGAEVEIEGSLIDIAARPGAPRRWQVTGQVSPAGTPAQIMVALARAGTSDCVAGADADESGMFCFEAPADRYDLLVRIDGSTIVIADLELK